MARSINSVQATDIRSRDLDNSLASDILAGLRGSGTSGKSLPTLILYDEEGLQKFEEITYLDEYYLTNDEIDVLVMSAAHIARQLPNGVQLLELGSGNPRKMKLLLDALEAQRKSAVYYALDVNLVELKRAVAALPVYTHIQCQGLYGTYDDARAWLDKPENRKRPFCVVSMGSSIGNFDRPEAARFLRGFAERLGANDSMMIGLDSCLNAEKVYRAYNDSVGLTRQFYLNGLDHANSVLGFTAFEKGMWDVVGEYDCESGCHRAFYVPLADVNFRDVHIKKGERIFFEQAYKYSLKQTEELWRDSGLVHSAQFGKKKGEYFIHLLSSPRLSFPMKASEYAKGPIPNRADFEMLWKVWDIVTLSMVPSEELTSKPIKLRNDLIFYLGHSPAFTDIHLKRATKSQLTEPREYARIFERGIDPDVDNPEICHSHSEIPDNWPPPSDILQYRDAVRDRVRILLEMPEVEKDRTTAEALWLGYEHEAMHLETFLYMVLQSGETLPPPGVIRPDFKLVSDGCPQAKWFTIPEQTVSIGLDDPEDTVPQVSFGFDNEKPRRYAHVPSFMAQGGPITNGDYVEYLQRRGINDIPASWTRIPSRQSRQQAVSGQEETSCVAVRTVFGPVPLQYALDWPVMASYDELNNFAKEQGCRIPSLKEVKSIYQHAARCNVESSSKLYSLVPSILKSAVSWSISKDNEMPVYVDLDTEHHVVGFKQWNQESVAARAHRLAGRGEFGGVWEWTSSPLREYEGFKKMDIYPGYTADFFDGKHNIVLGGSWATLPRIAGRTTFVNWYQRNYPYAWVGARLVKDV